MGKLEEGFRLPQPDQDLFDRAIQRKDSKEIIAYLKKLLRTLSSRDEELVIASDAAQTYTDESSPVGIIQAWMGGYFTNGSNGGYTRVLGTANTAAAVNALLNSSGWYVCDGAVLNDPHSSIFNGAGRYLPNLTDDRFLMGDTVAGGIGGSSTMPHTHSVTSNVTVANHTALALNNHTALALSNHTNHTALALNDTDLNLSVSDESAHTHTGPDHTHTGGSYAACIEENADTHNIHFKFTGSVYTWNGTRRMTHTNNMVADTSARTYGVDITGNSGSAGTGATGAGSAHNHGMGGTTGNHKHTFSQNIDAHSAHSFSQNIDAHSFSQNITAHSVTNNVVTSGAASDAENRPKYLSCFYIMKIK